MEPRSTPDAQLLFEASQALLALQDLPATLQTIAAKTRELLGTTHAQILLWDEAAQTLTLGAADGSNVGICDRLQYGLDRGVSGVVARTRQPLIVNEYQRWPHRFAEISDDVADIGVPLISRGRFLGVLTSCSTVPGTQFGEGHLHLLGSFAAQAAVAIDNARLYEETRRSQLLREHADAALHASEERYRRLFHEASEGIALADAETGTILDCNAAFERLSGYYRAELIGRPQHTLHPPEEDAPTVTRNFSLHLGSREGQTIASRLVTKTGDVRRVEVKAHSLHLDGRRVVQGFFRDVTDAARYQRERETTLTLLRLLNDQNHTHELIREVTRFLQEWTGCEAVGIRLHDGDDFPYYETRGFPAEFVQVENQLCLRDDEGVPLREPDGNPVLECMCGNILRGRFNPALPFFTPKGSFWSNGTTALLASTTEADRQARTRNRCNGEGYESVALIRLHYHGETLGLLQLNDHAPGRFTPELLAFLEKTADQIAIALAQREAQAALRESEAHYRQFVETAAEGIWAMDAQHRTTFVNARMASMLGYSEPEMLGRPVEVFMFDEDLAGHETRMVERHRGQDSRYKHRFRRKDGSEVWTQISATALTGPDGRFGGSFAMFTDITERRQAEEARMLLQQAVEQSADCIVITDAAGCIQYVNPAFERTTGYAHDEAIGQNPRILKSGRQDAAFYQAMWGRLTQGESWRGTFINRRKDGSLFEERAAISPVKNAAGETTHYVAVKRDVTRERDLELQLQQAQRMEAIGRLAGGVAHDFNNLLFLILGSAKILEEEHPDLDAQARELLEEIQNAGNRAAELTEQLLAFSRKQPRRPTRLDLNTCLANFQRMLGRVLGEKVRLATHLTAHPATLLFDPGQLEQIVLNLALNARDAMADGGTLTIETANTEAEPGGPGHAVQGPTVLLTVRDTGVGMDADTLAHLFEPFYTTKTHGKGTGLGLAIVHGIVEQNGGSIWVESTPDRGTTFRICLPLAPPETAPDGAHPASPSARGGAETILVVEDEASVRQLATRMLRRLGYLVLEASSGPEGLTLAATHRGAIALVLTDVIMPEMSGPEMVRRLAEERPEARVLYMSGYLGEELGASSGLDSQTPLLRKPFTPEDLARRVRQMLER